MSRIPQFIAKIHGIIINDLIKRSFPPDVFVGKPYESGILGFIVGKLDAPRKNAIIVSVVEFGDKIKIMVSGTSNYEITDEDGVSDTVRRFCSTI